MSVLEPSIDEIFNMYAKILLHGSVPDQVYMPGVVEQTHKAPHTEQGGVGDPNTGLSLMWMDKRPDGSIDPSKLVVTVNEAVNPVFVVESDTAIRVHMIRDLSQPRASNQADQSFYTIDGIDGDKYPYWHPKTLKYFDQASAVEVLKMVCQLPDTRDEMRHSLHVAEHKKSELKRAVADSK